MFVLLKSKTVVSFIHKVISISVALLFFSLFLFAQPLPCGNGRIDTVAENIAFTYRLSHGNSRILTVNNLLRVYFHIFNNDDGTNTACTPIQLESEFASLLSTYAPNNICFLICGVEYKNSTSLNMFFNADSDPSGSALSGYRVPNCINIFYMQKINGNNTACNPPCGYGGIALGGTPGTFFLVATGNIGQGSTIGHEMGHNLGLYHTFETVYGHEQINGGNGTTSGDKVADTNADPFFNNGTSCYSVSGCNYTGSCTDPNGNRNYSPPYTNLMSYWWSLQTPSNVPCYPTQVTTNGQFSRVNSFLASYSPLLDCESPSDYTINSGNIYGGYYMQTAINSLTLTTNVHLNASVISTLGAGKITLGPGFSASPNQSGLIHILPKPCQ